MTNLQKTIIFQLVRMAINGSGERYPVFVQVELTKTTLYEAVDKLRASECSPEGGHSFLYDSEGRMMAWSI